MHRGLLDPEWASSSAADPCSLQRFFIVHTRRSMDARARLL